jgi:hypothetical protein
VKARPAPARGLPTASEILTSKKCPKVGIKVGIKVWKRGGRESWPPLRTQLARFMIRKDKSGLLRRNTKRGRLIVTQRHHAETIRNFADSPDREEAFAGQMAHDCPRESCSRESVCVEPPHGLRRLTALQPCLAASSRAASFDAAETRSRSPGWPNKPEVARTKQRSRRVYDAVTSPQPPPRQSNGIAIERS